MTARLSPALLLAAIAGMLAQAAPPAVAQDKKDEKKDGAKQKSAAVANMKKADLGGGRVIETQNFLVGSTLSEEKAKALGALLEKVAPLARRAAQYEDKEEPWKGKLAVYHLPEGRDFKSFMRNVVVDEPNGVHSDLRSDDPFVVDPVEVSGKATEADQFANTAAVVAGAYLKSKGGSASLPGWLTDGFGRVTAMRAEGTNSKRYLAYKAAARTAAFGGKGLGPAALADLWAESRPANIDLIANSLAEFLAYGSGKENFPKVLAGFRPGENGTTPTAAQAFEAAGWKDVPALEAAWKRWVQTGK
jgi:hypothetical protein